MMSGPVSNKLKELKPLRSIQRTTDFRGAVECDSPQTESDDPAEEDSGLRRYLHFYACRSHISEILIMSQPLKIDYGT